MSRDEHASTGNGVTLRAILELPSLRHARVVAGEAGLDASVRWIHILDFPDIVPWVSSDDVVLTGTYAFLEDPSQLEGLVPRLVEKGVSGLIMGIGLFLKEIPRFMLEEAAERSFPIISIPWQTRFEDITFQAAGMFVLHERRLLKEIESAAHSLLEASRSTDHQQTVEILAGSLRRNVAIVNSGGHVLAASDGHVASFASEAYAAFLHRSPPATDRFRTEMTCSVRGVDLLVYPMSVATRCLGAIVVAEAAGMEVAQSLSLAVGSTVISSQLLHFEEQEASRSQVVSEYLQEVFRRSDRVSPQGLVEFFGWTEVVPHAVAILEIDGFSRLRRAGERGEPRVRELRSLVRARLRYRLEGVEHLVSEFSDHLAIVVMCESEDVALELLEPLRKELDALVAPEDCHITLGVSSVDDELHALPGKYEEARRAVTLTHRLRGPGHSASIQELRLPDFLSQLLETGQVEMLMAEVRRLEQYDREHNSAYLDTVAAFLQCFGSISETAELLSVHQNTVRYRIDRIEELLGRSVLDPDFRFGLELALQLRRLS